MALPSVPGGSWLSRDASPSRMVSTGSDEYRLYEQDGEFVLSVEMPGFDRDAIDIGWYEGRLSIAAESEDEHRDRKRTYRRTFRMPKRIDEDGIRARYENGVLDVYLPTPEGATTKGKSIPIE